MGMEGKIGLVVFDWAGTVIDFGCFAPLAGFIEAFAQEGVAITPAETRVPMGLHKKDHIRTLLEMPAVAERWLAKHGSAWGEDDVQRLFERFVPLQLAVLDQHSDLIPGLLETVKWCRQQDIKIAGTTGYFREAAEKVIAAAATAGYSPDVSMYPEKVRAGRPAPWMIYHIMETLGIYPHSAVVKVGDTIVDMEEGRNAGVWCVGVIATSSEMGLTRDQYEALPGAEKAIRHQEIERKLRAAGAHVTIDSVADLPKLLGGWPFA